MKTIAYIFLALIILLIATEFVFAQGGPPPMMPGSPSQAPIDGGLSLLAAAGGAYALKKLRDRNRLQDSDL